MLAYVNKDAFQRNTNAYQWYSKASVPSVGAESQEGLYSQDFGDLSQFTIISDYFHSPELFFSFCICLEIYYTIMYYFCYPSNLRIQEAWNPDDCVHNVLSLVKKPFRVAFSRIMLTQGLMEVVTTITQLSSLMIQGVYVIGIIVKYKRLRIRYTSYGNGMKDESWRHR